MLSLFIKRYKSKKVYVLGAVKQPVTVVTDPVVLSKAVDGVVLVVRARSSPRTRSAA